MGITVKQLMKCLGNREPDMEVTIGMEGDEYLTAIDSIENIKVQSGKTVVKLSFTKDADVHIVEEE